MFLIKREEEAGPAAEAMAAYVDALVVEGRSDAIAPDASLGEVTQRLRAEMRAVEPRGEFVDGLRLRLIAAADQRLPAHVVEEATAVWRQPRFIIGAAGLVSAAAVVAFVARSRMQTRAA